jgi:hypothetical protein
MMHLGDFAEDATVRFCWNSNAVAGESITRATNGTISVYKDGGTTQSTAGITDTEDFDSLTGVHLCVIDTSADAFYVAGSEYAVVLSGATIDGKTINAVLAHFSIERSGGALALLKNATYGLSALETLVDGIETTLSDGTNGLTAIKNAINTVDDLLDTEIASLTSTLSTVNGKIDTIDTNVDAILVDTGTDIPATLATIAGYIDTEIGSITSTLSTMDGKLDTIDNLLDTEIAALQTTANAIEADTQDIQSRLPAALTAGGNMKADVLAVDGSTGAATKLKKGVSVEVAGTCTTGGTTTSVVASALDPDSGDNDQFIGRIIIFDADTTTTGLRGQATDITDYVHATKTFTVTALTRAPASGDTFRII